MGKPDLGQKHECSECGARFYDLGKPVAVCPKCESVSTQVVGAIPEKRRRRRGEQIAAAKKEPEKQTVEIDEEDEEEDSDVEELDLDDAQAERHLSEAITNDDDDGDGNGETELSEVSDYDESELPDEVEVVGTDDSVSGDSELEVADDDEEA